ncbi:MAG: hypothetical protein B7Y42_05855 [Polaromonas sp. 28-63-22]|nr:MAG: hypothetical protein B7Y42_05855 [Polaromonas sp. 28-63-22]
MDRFLSTLIAVLLAALIGLGGYAWWQSRNPGPPGTGLSLPQATVPAPPASAAASAEPAIQYPIESAGAADQSPLPTLANSDTYLEEGIRSLMARHDMLRFVQLDGFARRVVATVDNLARTHAAPRLWPVNPTSGRFTTTETGATTTTISAKNSQRYTPLVHLIESLDTPKTVALYVRAYPLFQQAYEELGYPRGYFNDRLIAVIDHLLATPTRAEPLAVKLTEVKGPIETARPWVRYEFVDPALESLSAGQKMLLRTGPDNEARLKIKLLEFRRQLTSAAPAQPANAPKP